MTKNTIYYIDPCDCCKKIIKTIPNKVTVHFHDIRTSPLNEDQIDQLATLAGSYEALFNKRAHLYNTIGLKHRTLSEPDYKHYLSYHYTFLKHPIIVANNKIHVKDTTENTIQVVKTLK